MTVLKLTLVWTLLAATHRADASAASCLHPNVSTSAWRTVHSPRLPTFSVRIPPDFARDAGEDSYPEPQSPGSRWADSAHAQLVVHLVQGGRRLLGSLPTASGRPEYSRCVERIGAATAVIVSYNRTDDVGHTAYVGPFQVHAQLHWPDGSEVNVYGMADTRRRFLELLAAVRTIRRAS